MDGYLIDDENDIDMAWLQSASRICITAGASAPERLVQGVVTFLRKQGFDALEEMHGKDEQVSFQPAMLEQELR